ncbi:MAG: NtaA/DmoA family FMN-dependent monooxygenase [Corynebacterium sp.]|uniref:NtaA/DmoA family FMN-dependent monooxygenase n=2 Tax=Corynebacterium TaxID=1716 RepID=UPI003F948077
MTDKKQIILAAYVGGVNEHTLWEAPGAGSQIEFDTFRHVAQTAERGKFDYFFLAEGLAIRQHGNEFFDHDIVGRPDTLPVLASLAAVTEHIGLVGTINSTFNEPFELAREFASLDHLSGGRAGWNVVTSFDTFTGANFRKGGYLPREQRYQRAEETVRTVKELWDSWAADDIVADKDSGTFVRRADPGSFEHHGQQFDISGRFTVPRSPQGRPVIVQAGVSPDGRDFAAANADLIFSPYRDRAEASAFHRDINERVERWGRRRGDVKIVPSVGIVLGDSEDEARQRHEETVQQTYTPKTVRVLAEQIWNRDLSDVDVETEFPSFGPDLDAPRYVNGRTFLGDRTERVRELRDYAGAHRLSLRDAFIGLQAAPDFVGTPAQVAGALDDFVQQDASDGFVIGSPVVPTGIDEFVDKVVPLLQERGSLRQDYDGSTLRSNLGIPVPERGATSPAIYA